MRVIHLSEVRRLVDILDQETEGLASVMSTASSVSTLTSNLVAIVCKRTEDLRERCYTLQLLVDTQEDKWAGLKVWSDIHCHGCYI